MILRAALVLIASLALAACVSESDAERPQVAAPEAQTAALAPAPGAEKEEPPAPVVLPVPDPQEFKGFTEAELTQAMGKPDFTRKDRVARLWQYKGKECVLDLFLYPQKEGGMKVTHVDLRPRNNGQAIDAQSCFTDVVAARNKPKPAKG